MTITDTPGSPHSSVWSAASPEVEALQSSPAVEGQLSPTKFNFVCGESCATKSSSGSGAAQHSREDSRPECDQPNPTTPDMAQLGPTLNHGHGTTLDKGQPGPSPHRQLSVEHCVHECVPSTAEGINPDANAAEKQERLRNCVVVSRAPKGRRSPGTCRGVKERLRRCLVERNESTSCEPTNGTDSDNSDEENVGITASVSSSASPAASSGPEQKTPGSASAKTPGTPIPVCRAPCLGVLHLVRVASDRSPATSVSSQDNLDDTQGSFRTPTPTPCLGMRQRMRTTSIRVQDAGINLDVSGDTSYCSTGSTLSVERRRSLTRTNPYLCAPRITDVFLQHKPPIAPGSNRKSAPRRASLPVKLLSSRLRRQRSLRSLSRIRPQDDVHPAASVKSSPRRVSFLDDPIGARHIFPGLLNPEQLNEYRVPSPLISLQPEDVQGLHPLAAHASRTLGDIPLDDCIKHLRFDYSEDELNSIGYPADTFARVPKFAKFFGQSLDYKRIQRKGEACLLDSDDDDSDSSEPILSQFSDEEDNTGNLNTPRKVECESLKLEAKSVKAQSPCEKLLQKQKALRRASDSKEAELRLLVRSPDDDDDAAESKCFTNPAAEFHEEPEFPTLNAVCTTPVEPAPPVSLSTRRHSTDSGYASGSANTSIPDYDHYDKDNFNISVDSVFFERPLGKKERKALKKKNRRQRVRKFFRRLMCGPFGSTTEVEELDPSKYKTTAF